MQAAYVHHLAGAFVPILRKPPQRPPPRCADTRTPKTIDKKFRKKKIEIKSCSFVFDARMHLKKNIVGQHPGTLRDPKPQKKNQTDFLFYFEQ
jgi:hypothetical protein